MNKFLYIFSEVTILIDTKFENAEVELKVSYVVYNASWTPKYDVRVSSKDKSMVVSIFLIKYISPYFIILNFLDKLFRNDCTDHRRRLE